ncbi:MAG: hypothetical protein AAF598_08620 [Bacteroidota bacterium]
MKELLTQRTINILVGVFVVINIGLLSTLWWNKQHPSPSFEESISYRPLEELLRMDFGLSEAEIQTFRSNQKNLRQKVDLESRELFNIRQRMLELTAEGAYQSAEMKKLIRSLGERQSKIEQHTFEFLETVRQQVSGASEAERLELFQEIGRSLHRPAGPPPPR